MKPDSIVITLKDVKEGIRPTQMVVDMELELMNVFPKEKENRVLTVKLLSLLREGSMTQTDITEQLFDNAKMRASRVLGKLESWDYIKRKYDGQNKIVELDLSKEGE